MNRYILNQYKKYNYLNCDTKKPLVKILVSYVKPSFLFKSDIFVPIHLGRAIETENSKYGAITNDDLKWLHKYCIGDDGFSGNISSTNRRVGFLTGTYWAWKNYEKLGNPQYFGSFGYRRLLSPNFLDNIKQYDLILPNKKDFKIESIKEQFIFYHGERLYKNAIEIFDTIYPQETDNLRTYFNGTSGYFDEIYVIKKEIFFEFCAWIFPLLFAYLKMPQLTLKNNDMRDIGFIMERLTGYYCYTLCKQPNINFMDTDIIITEKLKANVNKDIFNKLRNHR